MKKLLIVSAVCAVLGGPAKFAEINAQEHKHEELQAQKESPETKNAPAAKAQGMPCCEMEKMGEMKEGMPMKGDMKAKMEKMEQMKAMKEKMAEKMKATTGDVVSEKTESKTEVTKSPEKSAHQH